VLDTAKRPAPAERSPGGEDRPSAHVRRPEGDVSGWRRPAPVQRKSERSAGGEGARHEPVQRLAEPTPAPGSDPAAVQEAAARGLAGPGQPLPHLEDVQRSFGHHDLGGVRAHVGGPAAEASRDMGASAYATGSDVAFSRAPDLHTAAHEAAHVVQQAAGVQLAEGVGDAGDRHERHADAVADLVVQGKSSEGLLEEYGADHAADHAVQRIYQPIVEKAPATAISIRDFIALVEGEEKRWPVAEQTQTSLMISRIRKIFYGSEGWDKHLIPGAASISSGYNIRQQETGRENLTLTGVDADIVRTRQIVTDASGHSPAIADQQEVRLEDGTFADIGHVFTGLDAANHPTSVSAPLGLVSLKDSKAAVTWTGDIGSSLAEIIFYGLNHPGAAVPTSASQPIINEYASPQDMLGDIDAYVMADQYDISNTSGKKVSELLRAYYLGAATSPDGRAREHRYSRFCALTGLTGWSSGSFANEKDWVDRWTPEVGAAAALYVGATTSGILAGPGRAGVVLGTKDHPIARILVQAFLDALKTRVAAEPP
jgi:Domain of unknown function (DUF4157)